MLHSSEFEWILAIASLIGGVVSLAQLLVWIRAKDRPVVSLLVYGATTAFLASILIVALDHLTSHWPQAPIPEQAIATPTDRNDPGQKVAQVVGAAWRDHTRVGFRVLIYANLLMLVGSYVRLVAMFHRSRWDSVWGYSQTNSKVTYHGLWLGWTITILAPPLVILFACVMLNWLASIVTMIVAVIFGYSAVVYAVSALALQLAYAYLPYATRD